MSPHPTHAHASYSRFVQRVRRRYGPVLALLSQGMPDPTTMESMFLALRAQGQDVGAALRITRHAVMERLAVLDCEAQAPLAAICTCVTHLAQWALNHALQEIVTALTQRHGTPRNLQGEDCAFWVLGMGKLGAWELNVSSDIDLIFAYEEEGQTAGGDDGRASLSHSEFFARAVRGVATLLGDVGEHGQVFRVDLALRPNGNSGPPASSVAALESYFQVQGREWERFAWLKSRVVAAWGDATLQRAAQLRNLVLPFVFRRYLDYAVFEGLRTLHQQIRSHTQQKAAGNMLRANDVKLGRGGIREIEFIVQLLQVVRAGQFPELRTRATLKALERLTQAGLMPDTSAQALHKAYAFLRQVEHRIQYLDDQQTHALPSDASDQDWIAHTLGLTNGAALQAQLQKHRDLVASEFEQLLGASTSPVHAASRASHTAGMGWEVWLENKNWHPHYLGTVKEWVRGPRVQTLRDASRTRLMQLVERTAHWLEEKRITETGALRWLDWMEHLLKRESYLALLVERPKVHRRLVRLLGAALWAVRFLKTHPGTIDELASESVLHERFQPDSFRAELTARKQALALTQEDDDEALLNVLRRAQHAEQLRTLVRDLEGTLTLEQVADDLSLLADTVLAMTTEWCWQRQRNKQHEELRLAILGYGKLGGKELGYGSDLDIVFIYDDDPQAMELHASLARKIIHWLSVKTSEGDLYEIDTALRPNGNSGLLVSSFAAFARYQQQHGSNTAWTWEHQAITRARWICGHAPLQHVLDEVRLQVLIAPRDPQALRKEIAAMRSKVQQAQRSHILRAAQENKIDLKYSPGAMMDAEFSVQYLVLAQASQHPDLQGNWGNIALLQHAERAGLIPSPMGQAAAQAYRHLRHLQHQARLQEAPGLADLSAEPDLAAHVRAVKMLWEQVFQE